GCATLQRRFFSSMVSLGADSWECPSLHETFPSHTTVCERESTYIESDSTPSKSNVNRTGSRVPSYAGPRYSAVKPIFRRSPYISIGLSPRSQSPCSCSYV